MGLDMYLEKYPRIEGIDLRQIIAAENWFSYCSREARFADSSFKDWCDMTEEDLPSKEALETLRPYFIKRYYAWIRITAIRIFPLANRLVIGGRLTRFIAGLLIMCRMERMTVITIGNVPKRSLKNCLIRLTK